MIRSQFGDNQSLFRKIEACLTDISSEAEFTRTPNESASYDRENDADVAWFYIVPPHSKLSGFLHVAKDIGGRKFDVGIPDPTVVAILGQGEL